MRVLEALLRWLSVRGGGAGLMVYELPSAVADLGVPELAAAGDRSENSNYCSCCCHCGCHAIKLGTISHEPAPGLLEHAHVAAISSPAAVG